MKCTICQSTGFRYGQCLGCGIMVRNMPAKTPVRDWDYNLGKTRTKQAEVDLDRPTGKKRKNLIEAHHIRYHGGQFGAGEW